jgi:hypothetical protein
MPTGRGEHDLRLGLENASRVSAERFKPRFTRCAILADRLLVAL